MFKITIEGSGDHAKVTCDVENEKLVSICYALSSAIMDISKMADVTPSELLLHIKAFICVHTMRGRKYEQPDESL